MGRFSWIIQGAKCHHKGPYKRDTEESESEMRGRKQREREREVGVGGEATFLPLKMEEIATRQGMGVISRKLERQRNSLL